MTSGAFLDYFLPMAEATLYQQEFVGLSSLWQFLENNEAMCSQRFDLASGGVMGKVRIRAEKKYFLLTAHNQSSSSFAFTLEKRNKSYILAASIPDT